ncbi:MAG TPA: proline dehydrogenase family protein [Jiangellaceae bacterium]|nr:proline dehydrogenase family protein [Jiangellaceae bacterium]
MIGRQADVVGRVLLGVSRSERLRYLVEKAPISRNVVARFIAGAETEDAVRVTREIVADGLTATIDHLGEDTADRAQAEEAAAAYVALLKGLNEAGLTSSAEVSVKLSAVGQALVGDGERIALENAREICQAAADVGTTVTLDMEDHTTTDSTLSILDNLRTDFPSTGAVLQAYLHRTEGDCRRLAHAGSRVRLCKGAYNEPASVAYQGVNDVDRSYVRCMKVLLAGPGYPMIATHDPRLIEIAGSLAARYRREQGSYEYQMLYGVRPEEQRRLARSGETVRVYVPYGHEWYGYMMRRLAERPANVMFFLRSLAGRK